MVNMAYNYTDMKENPFCSLVGGVIRPWTVLKANRNFAVVEVFDKYFHLKNGHVSLRLSKLFFYTLLP